MSRMNGTYFYNGKEIETLYEVEAIRDKRKHKGKVQYLIKWSGWPESTNTWEPLKNLKNVRDMIDDFEESLNSSVKNDVIHDTQQQEEEQLQQPSENEVQQDNASSSRNPPTTLGNGSSIVKVVRAIDYKDSCPNKDEGVTFFMAIRSDGTEVIVDNKYLRRYYQSLLLDFYEDKFKMDLIRSIPRRA